MIWPLIIGSISTHRGYTPNILLMFNMIQPLKIGSLSTHCGYTPNILLLNFFNTKFVVYLLILDLWYFPGIMGSATNCYSQTIPSSVVNSWCYVNSLYLSKIFYNWPPLFNPLVHKLEDVPKTEIKTFLKYYLWTPVIFVIVAAIMHLPHLVWTKYAHNRLVILFKGKNHPCFSV